MTAPTDAPQPSGSHEADVAELATHGYQQRLNRSLGGFSSFAAGFSYISILTGMFQLFGFGFGYGFGGPLLLWAWLIVLGGQFCVALVFADNAKNAVFLGTILIIITTIINVLGVRVMSKINNVGVMPPAGATPVA